MKILISGSRKFTDKYFLDETLNDIVSKEQYNREIPNSGLEMVSGNNPSGADWLCERWAKANNISLKLFPANWSDINPATPKNWGDKSPTFLPKDTFYGVTNKMAGYLRNQEMANYVFDFDEKVMIAFRIGESPGTSDMIRRAKKLGIKIYQIDYDKDKKIKIWNGG
jgi:hypothetical protein